MSFKIYVNCLVYPLTNNIRIDDLSTFTLSSKNISLDGVVKILPFNQMTL